MLIEIVVMVIDVDGGDGGDIVSVDVDSGDGGEY